MGFSALKSIVFSWLPILFFFDLVGLIEVDSCAGGEILKSVAREVLESVNKVLFRLGFCPVQGNGGNLFSLMSDGSGICFFVTHILFKVAFEVWLWSVAFCKLLLNLFGTSSVTCWSEKKSSVFTNISLSFTIIL